MSTPILATKLYVPPPRPNGILRPRLVERLNVGLHRKLTLISAPAGFGKTTLVSSWLAARTADGGLRTATVTASPSPQHAALSTQVAWLSLDEGDSDPTRFLTYLVAALQTIAPTIGAGIVSVLQSSQPAPTEALLTALLNDITTCLPACLRRICEPSSPIWNLICIGAPARGMSSMVWRPMRSAMH